MADSRVGPIFSALADANRRHLIETLAEREEATLSELAAELPVTRQAVSKHLAALGEAGLVSATRSGRETRYRLTPAALSDAVSWIERVGAQWDDRLAALRVHLVGSEARSETSGPRRGGEPDA
jgi:DNA-binding transcriptional ArsR family regulator